jgi:hypothetical protein
VPTSGGITQARQRLGHEPLQELFTQVAVPVNAALLGFFDSCESQPTSGLRASVTLVPV